MEETWKDISGYEGFYQISNLGKVKALPREKNNQYSNKEIILKQSNDNKGYLQVVLNKEGKRKGFKVHRLVAEAFLNKNNFKSMKQENRKKININKLEVNHIKENEKHNNSVNNLEWCTKLYNCNYGNRNKKVAHFKKINQYDLNNNFIKQWNSIKEANEITNICRASISSCLRKITKQAGGYIWRYCDE